MGGGRDFFSYASFLCCDFHVVRRGLVRDRTLLSQKWLHVIINDDFLEKGECYDRALLPSIICLGRLRIASKCIYNLWQLRWGVYSLAQWLEHWIFREDRVWFPQQAGNFFIPLLRFSCRKNMYLCCPHDNHQMIITPKYGSHHFTGCGENAILPFPHYKSTGAFCCHSNQTKRQITMILATCILNCPYPSNICTKLESYCFSGFEGVIKTCIQSTQMPPPFAHMAVSFALLP